MKNIDEYALLICDSNYGDHIPQTIAREFAPCGNSPYSSGHFSGHMKFTFDWSDVDAGDINSLINGYSKGCGAEQEWFYWEAWANVKKKLKIEVDGEKYHIIENFGAWLIPDECMNQLEDWLI